jgi:hypothetical protein
VKKENEDIEARKACGKYFFWLGIFSSCGGLGSVFLELPWGIISLLTIASILSFIFSLLAVVLDWLEDDLERFETR